jgi:hypothetical protein
MSAGLALQLHTPVAWGAWRAVIDIGLDALNGSPRYLEGSFGVHDLRFGGIHRGL